MRYEWDADKRAETLARRGIDFAFMDYFEWATALTRRSDRYGEIRWSSYGLIQDRLFKVIWTERGESIRIISLRKANSREIRNYGEQSP